MDCCGSSNPKENDKEIKTDKLSSENNPAQKEHTHAGGGCCGGGANGMWLHLVLYKRVRNMKKKTVIVIGILMIMLVFGAAVALAQNTGSEKSKDLENHECTPEMMENMPENC